MATKLDFVQIEKHMRTLHNECQRLATHQTIKDAAKLERSLTTLGDALQSVILGCIAGNLDMQLSQIFDETVLPNENDIQGMCFVLNNIHQIFKLRNRFLDQVKKLPSDEKDARFGEFLKSHKLAVNLLKEQYPIDINQCPCILRGIIRHIVDSAYRTE